MHLIILNFKIIIIIISEIFQSGINNYVTVKNYTIYIYVYIYNYNNY